MDKRKMANIRVKSSITKALFRLMREKSFSDISISERSEEHTSELQSQR